MRCVMNGLHCTCMCWFKIFELQTVIPVPALETSLAVPGAGKIVDFVTYI